MGNTSLLMGISEVFRRGRREIRHRRDREICRHNIEGDSTGGDRHRKERSRHRHRRREIVQEEMRHRREIKIGTGIERR